MKKLMFALATAVIAAGLQAATATWSMTGVSYSSANPYVNDSTAGTYIGFLVDQSFANYADVDALVAAIRKDGANAKGVILSTTGTAKDVSGVKSITFAPGAKTPLSKEPQTYTANQGIEAYSIVFDASSAADAKNYMVAYKESIGFNQNLNLSASFGTQASNTWQSVPEPTSGLLLLLGVAGLALRRRRA